MTQEAIKMELDEEDLALIEKAFRDNPLVRLALLDASSKTVACIYRIAIERANISEYRKDRLKKGFLNYLHTIMEGDGIEALLEEETKE